MRRTLRWGVLAAGLAILGRLAVSVAAAVFDTAARFP
jgi:hypothetical protein